MNFIDLFDLGEGLLPAEGQKLRGEMFELKFREISQNRMQLWKENPNNATDTKFILGVCPIWNFYDLYLLDCINNAIKETDFKEVFQVTNLDLIENLSNTKKVFGDIEPKQSPILGIWKKGILIKSLWGWEAKNFLIDKYKFIWSPNPPYIN